MKQMKTPEKKTTLSKINDLDENNISKVAFRDNGYDPNKVKFDTEFLCISFINIFQYLLVLLLL